MTKGKLQELKDLFHSTYLIEDKFIIDVLCANYISFLTKTDPVWTIIVGPSSGGKSEAVNALSTCKYVHPISTITANTFVSGAKLGGGKPASLLMKLSKGTDLERSGIITLKDFTSLMSEQEANQKIIMAQLREIFDSEYNKEFGTGQSINWKGKVTVIAASTFKIHDLRQQYSAMGERFLMYELAQPDRKEASSKAMTNQESGRMKEMRDAIAEMMRLYLNEVITIPSDLPPISEELKNDLLDLAEMATRARSDVKRAWYSPQKEILEVYPPEMPMRFAGSLQTLARCLMILNWNETDEMTLPVKYHKILHKYALDSITPGKRQAMQELAKYNVLETTALGLKLDKPSSTLRRYVEDLVALGIAGREKGSGSKGDRWSIKPHYKKIIQKFEGITQEADELNAMNVESQEDLLAEAEEVRDDVPRDALDVEDTLL